MRSRIKLFNKISYFLLLGLLCSGCQNYYRISKNNYQDHIEKTVDSLITENKYFILRTSNEDWYLKYPALAPDKKTLTGTLDSVPLEHMLHVIGLNSKMNYLSKHSAVLNEVHLFVSDSTALSQAAYSLPLGQVRKIEIVEKNKKKTTNSHIAGAGGVIAGVAIITAIALAGANTDFNVTP